MMTFPIKNLINTKLFIGTTAALYGEETRIRVLTNGSHQPAGSSLLKERVYLAQKCYLDIERVWE